MIAHRTGLATTALAALMLMADWGRALAQQPGGRGPGAETEAEAEDDVEGEGEGEGEGETDEVEEAGGGLQTAKFMPLGKPNLKVKIPQFKDGVLECVMRADKMTRVDEDNIDIETMDIDFLEDGAPSMSIELQDANYSLGERLLSSDRRAVVRRADFTLVGDSLEFDTVERRGRMAGRVRMVIHDSKAISSEEEEREPAPATEAPPVPSGPWAARVAGQIAGAMLAQGAGGAPASVEGGGDDK